MSVQGFNQDVSISVTHSRKWIQPWPPLPTLFVWRAPGASDDAASKIFHMGWLLTQRRNFTSLCVQWMFWHPLALSVLSYLLEDDCEIWTVGELKLNLKFTNGSKLGFPKEHEVRRQPASPKYQEILSSAWLCSFIRTTQNFGLREMMDSVATALGWVWDMGLNTLVFYTCFLRACVGQSISLCLVPTLKRSYYFFILQKVLRGLEIKLLIWGNEGNEVCLRAYSLWAQWNSDQPFTFWVAV